MIASIDWQRLELSHGLTIIIIIIIVITDGIHSSALPLNGGRQKYIQYLVLSTYRAAQGTAHSYYDYY